ncbi:hypothetical protein [Rhabdothermincola salaria]|uniref:hypothetical protein n=1 Tax=Rhabdothermincola salaria TaxID=2903142 RepID=UPI001E2B9C28|nr:hypothetical protein [Rhabdothermincola salaria]MCD9623077.1 hypothetical protein [Rhabdothermincola salaria]
MATIRATCPTCGDVELSTADVQVRVSATERRSSYAFVCPRCETTVVKPAEPRTIDLLLASGVAYELSMPTVEVADHEAGGAPITSAELQGFQSLLGDDDELWAAFDAAESQDRRRR